MNFYPAPAKLNLFLHVVGRRADGYHLLQSVFRFIDFADELGFSVRDDGLINHLNPIPGVEPESDLCVRAARLLQKHCACPLGADIQINKRLPMGGGLGGGSSDAATTLIALNHLWQTGLNREELQQLGLSLGADVPVFVFGQNAFAEGVGEILSAVELDNPWYVVLIPPVHVSTPDIFRDEGLTRDTEMIRMRDFKSVVNSNDLQTVVCRRYPEVKQCLEWLSDFAPAKMTGSGACVFAEFASEASARNALEKIPDTLSGFVAKGLSQHPLYGLL